MSFSITPRVLPVLCLAVASVAGQWTGNYNTTSVDGGIDPPKKCWIESLDPSRGAATAIYPCTCTGGTVLPDCNWSDFALYNSVRDAKCKCSTAKRMDAEPESLQKYGQDTPAAVTKCVCDPPAAGNEAAGTDGLVVPAPNCWCPAESLQDKSGLSEAKEAAPPAPAVEQPQPEQQNAQQCNEIRMKALRDCRSKDPSDFNKCVQVGQDAFVKCRGGQ